MKDKILEIICGAGMLLSTVGAFTYAIKENCPDYVGRSSIALLTASGIGLAYKQYKDTLDNEEEK